MAGGSFYRGREWVRLRAAILARDAHRCATPGCTTRATHVDHVLAINRGGGALDPANLRCLCPRCHSRKTAAADGGFGNNRRSTTTLRAIGCDADGWPTAPPTRPTRP